MNFFIPLNTIISILCYRYHYYGLGIKTTSRYYSKDYADKQANPAPKKEHSQKVVKTLCVLYVCVLYVCVLYVCVLYVCVLYVCVLYVCVLYVCVLYVCVLYVCVFTKVRAW